MNDWYDFLTPTIIKYFLEHKAEARYAKMFDYHYLATLINRKTGKIVPMPGIYQMNGKTHCRSCETIYKKK